MNRDIEGFLTVVLGGFLVVLVMGLLLAILLALPVMLLWNFVMPDITRGAVTPLTFWQAFALGLLCCFLFKSHATSSKESK